MKPMEGFYYALMTAADVAGLVVNLILIVTIAQSDVLRKNLGNIFLVNLSIIGVLNCILVTPVAIAGKAYGQWPLNGIPCQVSGFLNIFFLLISIMGICVLTAERLYAIKWPFHHAGHLTLRKVLGTITITWIIGAVVAACPLLGWNAYEFNAYEGLCSLSWKNELSSTSYIFFIGIAFFVIPLAVLCALNLATYREARRIASAVVPSIVLSFTDDYLPGSDTGSQLVRPSISSGASSGTEMEIFTIDPNCVKVEDRMITGSMGAEEQDLHVDRNNSKKAKLVLTLLMTTFVILFGPFFTVNAFGIVLGIWDSGTIETLSVCLIFCTYAVNPCLYGLLNRPIREGVVDKFQSFKESLRKRSAEVDPSNDIETVSGGPEDIFEFLTKTASVL